MQISILTVMYSLILCGKTYTIDYKTYYLYLYHLNINFLYKMLILIPLYIYLGYVIKNLKNQKVIISAALIVIITAGIHYGIDCKNSANLFMNKMHNLKKEQYMYQKIMRYYHLKNQTAKIPEMFTKDYSGLNCSEAHKSVEIESQRRIFRDNLAMVYGYEIVPNGLDLFYADGGGYFSEEELKDIKFSRLYDKNFVLNKYSLGKIEKQ